MHKDPKKQKAITYYKTGNDFLRRGKYLEAARNYEQAIAADPFYFKAFCNLGVAQKNLHNFKLAEDAFSKALKLKPSDPMVLNNLGNLYLNANRFDEAEKLYLKAIKISPNYRDAIYNLGQLYYFTGRQEKAVVYRMRLEQILKKNVVFNSPEELYNTKKVKKS